MRLQQTLSAGIAPQTNVSSNAYPQGNVVGGTQNASADLADDLQMSSAERTVICTFLLRLLEQPVRWWVCMQPKLHKYGNTSLGCTKALVWDGVELSVTVSDGVDQHAQRGSSYGTSRNSRLSSVQICTTRDFQLHRIRGSGVGEAERPACALGLSPVPMSHARHLDMHFLTARCTERPRERISNLQVFQYRLLGVSVLIMLLEGAVHPCGGLIARSRA